jgi:hypothetical protein
MAVNFSQWMPFHCHCRSICVEKILRIVEDKENAKDYIYIYIYWMIEWWERVRDFGVFFIGKINLMFFVLFFNLLF